MFRRWIDREGVSRRLLARADGERRMTNLLHLGELLHQVAQEQPAPRVIPIESRLNRLVHHHRHPHIGSPADIRACIVFLCDPDYIEVVTVQ